MNKVSLPTHKNILWLIIVGAVGLVAVSFWVVLDRVQKMDQVVSIGGKTYSAEIARTESERAKGLSGRDGLASNKAMLFVFEADGYHGFWMKDMKFAIDIVWLDSNKKVVHIERNVPPHSVPRQSYWPPELARYVLELAAGQAAGVSIGETAVFGGGI